MAQDLSNPDEIVTKLDAYAQDIRHEFGAASVQIFVNIRDKNQATHSFGAGKGSFYERVGACQTWINQETTK